MKYSLRWMPEASITFKERITYLKTYWTEREIARFNERVLAYLETLTSEPYIGNVASRKMYISD